MTGRGRGVVWAAGTVVAVLVLSVMPLAAGAAVITVETCAESALRAAIDTAPAGATVTFGCTGEITLSRTIDVERGLTLDGSGQDVTISGGGAVRLFWHADPSNAPFTLRHLRLAHGSTGRAAQGSTGVSGSGGAIFSGSTLIVDHVHFADNVAESRGGAIASHGVGASLTVTDSTFSGNIATQQYFALTTGGGAIAVSSGGVTTITRSTFTGNSTTGVGSGGAVLAAHSFQTIETGPVQITDSDFIGNTATVAAPFPHPLFTSGGGAVAAYNRVLTIGGSTFEDNELVTGPHAQGAGGAVLIEAVMPPGDPLASATITDSHLEGNSIQPETTRSRGGALAIRGAPTAVQRTTFDGNVAHEGGAIVVTGAEVALTEVDVTGNHATSGDGVGAGGGVLSSGTTTLTESTLTDNRTNCGRVGAGRFIDGGDNIEQGGAREHSCGLGEHAPAVTSLALSLVDPHTGQPTDQVQHSDPLAFVATVTDAATGSPVTDGDVQFSYDTSGSSGFAEAVTDTQGLASAVMVFRHVIAGGQGTAHAEVAPTWVRIGASDRTPLTVVREELVVTVQTTSTESGSIELVAELRDPDGSYGDLQQATPVVFSVIPLTGGGTSHSCQYDSSGPSVNLTGTGIARCTVDGVVAGTYTVTAEHHGYYYTGSGSAQLVVTDPPPRVEVNASPGDRVRATTPNGGITLVTPNAGPVVLDVGVPKGRVPAGFTYLPVQVDITAPVASGSDPLRLTFAIDVGLLPAGVTGDQVLVFRNGRPLPECPGATTGGPCVTDRQVVGDVLLLAVITPQASVWNVGLRDGARPPGTQMPPPPVDPDPTDPAPTEPTPTDPQTPGAVRLDGGDRVDAAIAWSRFRFDDGAGATILLGRDDVFADALASGPVQGMLDAPLLLTAGDALDARTAAELQRLGARTVIILGGTAAVSEAVADELTAAGLIVDRVGGDTRVTTATAMAERFFADATAAIVVRAYGDPDDPTRAFADSLGAGAFGSATARPVLLSDTHRLSAPVAAHLAGSSISGVILAGGVAALSAEVATTLAGLGVVVDRADGAERFQTAALLAAWTGFDDPSQVLIVDGAAQDAWASGFAAAASGAHAPLLLTDGARVPDATRDALRAFAGSQPVCGPGTDSAACDTIERTTSPGTR